MDSIVGQRIEEHDGEQIAVDVTVTDRILASLRSGNYFEQACAQAGIHRQTGYGWLRIGARTYERVHRLLTTHDKLTLHEQRCIAFSAAVAQAEAEWEVNANNVLENLGRGGIVQTTVTEKTEPDATAPGGFRVIERTTRRETLAPNPQVIEWRLTRRFPERYTAKVDLTIEQKPTELSVEERARILADELRAAIVKGAPTPALEAGSTVRCGAHPTHGRRGYRDDFWCVREAGHGGRHRYEERAVTVGQPNESEATP